MAQFSVLTRDEAAKLARISPRSLDRHIATETGPQVTRIGRRVLLPAIAFEEWVQRGALSPKQQTLIAATQAAAADFATAAAAMDAVQSCKESLSAMAGHSDQVRGKRRAALDQPALDSACAA